MTASTHGLLAIWSTVQESFETDYLHWLTREHIFERVGVPGFVSGRAYRRRDSAPSEYVIVYTLENASVMASEGYIARLNDPTPWTQSVMPHLGQFRRGGGTAIARAGRPGAFGARLAVARFDTLPSSVTQEALDAVAAIDRVTQTWVMTVAPDATSIATREKSMRSGTEGIFNGVMAVEALDDASLNQATHAAQALTRHDCCFEPYDFVFSFSKTH